MSTATDTNNSGRNLALDGIRGLAAFSVLISHYFPQNKFWWILQWGKIGVVTFFILSGYLIVSILLNSRQKIEEGHSLKDIWTTFYIRRALRILPLYFGVVIAFCLLRHQNTIDTFWWHATFTSNIGSAIFKINFDNFSHFWSICIEEQFYLVIPAIVLCMERKKSFQALTWIFFLCMAFKIGYSISPLDKTPLARLPISNVEGIAFGALTAYSFHLRNAKIALDFIAKRITPIAILVFLAMSVYRFMVGVPAYTTFLNISIMDLVIALTFGPLVAKIAYHKESKAVTTILSSKPLVYLGTISFGTYVYHYAILIYIPAFLSFLSIQEFTITAFFAQSALALAIASLSWHFLEKQVLKLKTPYKYRTATTVSTEGKII